MSERSHDYPLARLISEWLAYLRNKGETANLAGEIRHILGDVENVARFAAPKYLGCYLDVLRIYLTEKGETDKLDELPDFDVLLEYGVVGRPLSVRRLPLSERTSRASLARH
jgi:hypothetical protein